MNTYLLVNAVLYYNVLPFLPAVLSPVSCRWTTDVNERLTDSGTAKKLFTVPVKQKNKQKQQQQQQK